MRVSFPLYGKILGWFFLNLVAVAVVVVLLFDAQFHFNLDWFLSFGARERLEAVRDLIVGELELNSPEDWERILQRYSEAQHVHFALYDDEADLIVGGVTELPAEVRARILARPTFGRTPRPNSEPPVELSPTPEGMPSSREGFRRWAPRLPIRALMRTQHPTQYWLLASGRLDNPLAGPPFRVVVVAQSETLSAGGLVFDPKPWLALVLGVVLFSLLFWLPLVRGITRTVARMMQATRQIADGRFDVRLKMRRGDELGALGGSIDQMAARLDGLITGQKRFLGDVAHELCSPLARLQLALGVLEQRVQGSDAAFVKSASEKAEQISTLVGELLSFSKASYGAQAVRLRPIKVRDAAEDAVRREKTEEAEVQIEVPSDLQVSADPDLLVRALANLLRNAIRHAGQAGPIVIRADRSGGEVAISVADAGPGVPEAELLRIFDAFYRLDTARTRETGGTGLGLAIVKACIDSCCGSVTARNRDPRGLEVLIHLPIADATAVPDR
jgi:two-component system sensor histidine kinase CpxA